jgi:hypothetical protein
MYTKILSAAALVAVLSLWHSSVFGQTFNSPSAFGIADSTLIAGISSKAEEDGFPEFKLNGYVKYLPSLRTSPVFQEPFFDHLLHNRLNASLDWSQSLTLRASLRTRAFYGSTVREFPFFKDFLREDFGVLGLNWIVGSGESYILHSTLDRLFIDYQTEKWQLSIGRQRINWGINLVSNPNDLFNTYSFFDFDYEERPGTDAVRFQYFLGDLSRWEIAVAPGERWEETVAAAFYSFNTQGFDFQFLSGYFRDRFALGSGWAGHIGQSGFKAEWTYFHDLNPIEGRDKANWVASVSGDYLFGNGMFLVLEYLWNQPRAGVGQDLLLFTQPLSADNLSFTDHSLFAQLRYPINPIWSASLAGFYYPSEAGVFLSPSLNVNPVENVDVLLIGQVFRGKEQSILAQAGSLVAAAIKWNF